MKTLAVFWYICRKRDCRNGGPGGAALPLLQAALNVFEHSHKQQFGQVMPPLSFWLFSPL